MWTDKPEEQYWQEERKPLGQTYTISYIVGSLLKYSDTCKKSIQINLYPTSL